MGLSAGTKAAVAIVGTIASTAMTVYSQQQQAKGAQANAAYNAQLNRMDMAQNDRNRDIERTQDLKRYKIQQGKMQNEDMPLDFMYADLESFEYQALVKDYAVAQANQSLEARARGGIYQGNVRAANLQTASYATALGGASDAVMMGIDPASGESRWP
jgi:type II secretory pathway pseudopilin PulG